MDFKICCENPLLISQQLNISKLMSPFDAREVICYPHKTSRCVSVIKRLSNLNVSIFTNVGRQLVHNFKVLGKGHSAIVVAGVFNGNLVAIKIRRQDSKRESLRFEGDILSLLSKYNIAPRVHYYDDDIIIMDLIQGVNIRDFITVCSQKLKDNLLSFAEIKNAIRFIVHKLIDITFLMDKLSVVHKEISRPDKHIMIDCLKNEIYLIDFESASLNHKGNNLTSIISGLIIRTSLISNFIRDILEVNNTMISKLKELLTQYKRVSLKDKNEIVKYIKNLLS